MKVRFLLMDYDDNDEYEARETYNLDLGGDLFLLAQAIVGKEIVTLIKNGEYVDILIDDSE